MTTLLDYKFINMMHIVLKLKCKICSEASKACIKSFKISRLEWFITYFSEPTLYTKSNSPI